MNKHIKRANSLMNYAEMFNATHYLILGGGFTALLLKEGVLGLLLIVYACILAVTRNILASRALRHLEEEINKYD